MNIRGASWRRPVAPLKKIGCDQTTEMSSNKLALDIGHIAKVNLSSKRLGSSRMMAMLEYCQILVDHRLGYWMEKGVVTQQESTRSREND